MSRLREQDAIAWLLVNVPEGWTQIDIDGDAWGVTRTSRAGGRTFTFTAERLGARYRLSANIWITSDGATLRPCEVPVEQVLAFVGSLANSRKRNKENHGHGNHEWAQ